MEHLTNVLRGDIEEAKLSDKYKAAEFLDKYITRTKEHDEKNEKRVVIIDDI